MNRRQQIARAKAEIDRLASAATDLELLVLSGQARRNELDRIIGKAEDVTARIRELEQLKKQTPPAGRSPRLKWELKKWPNR